MRLWGTAGCGAMLAALLVGGCGWQTTPSSGTSPEKAAAPQKVVGAALLTQTHVFYQDMVAAMQDEARKQGFALHVQYAEFDSSKQNNQIETFIIQGVDALIIAPNDSAGIAPVIAEARGKGIPVFTVDIAAHGADVVSHIASDNVKGGAILADYLAKLLGEKGRVAIIDHPAVASVQERVSGFEKALAKYPHMTIVQKVPGEGQRDKAFRAAQDLLQANPDLNGVFGINDDSALGALAAVEAAGLQDKMVIVGYDGTPEAREAILQGKALKADTVQFPKDIGRRAIQAIAAYFRGETAPEVVPVDVAIIDQASLKAERR
jgi:ribose transport system substrate-binding protein